MMMIGFQEMVLLMFLGIASPEFVVNTVVQHQIPEFVNSFASENQIDEDEEE